MSRPTGPTDAQVRVVWERDKGRCALCGKPLVWEQRGHPFGWSYSHRAGRLMGGTKAPWINWPSNGNLLCGSGTTLCHGDVTHNPRRYADLGFIVRRGIRPPAEVPIQHALYGECWLTDDGRAVPVGSEPPLLKGE